MITYPPRRRSSPPSRTSRPDDSPLTLTEEHALLLRQVAARTEDLLTVTAGNRWPQRELQALVGYLRTEVMRQVIDEEWLLFRTDATGPDLSGLERDHLRLRRGVQALAEAADGRSGWSTARLATTTQHLLALLEDHLLAEDALLLAASAPRGVPATEVLTGRPHEWYPLTEGTAVDLDALPADQAIDATVERLRRLRPGERVELRSGSDLNVVWERMDRLDPGGYGFVYLQEGPQWWVLQVTRRPAA